MSRTPQNVQRQKAFFDWTDAQNHPTLPKRPTEDQIRWMVSEKNPYCPLNEIVIGPQNREAMHSLRSFCFSALSRYNHSCRGQNFGIYSGPGQGKTTVVKALARTVDLPTVFIQSDALESTWQLFQLMSEKMIEVGTPLVPLYHDRNFHIPPCLVILDEAHALLKDLRTGGLLNAMEGNDGWLRTQPPGKNQRQYEIDCREVCWIAATTDPGILFSQSEAFYTRLGDHIVWHDATPDEVRQTVQSRHPHLSAEACRLTAHYVRNPREAIAFAGKLQRDQRMTGDSWEVSARRVAHVNGIDEHGMLYSQVKILTALGKRPVASNRVHICVGDGCRREQAEKMLMPPLLKDSDGRGPLVQATGKGYALTRTGRLELLKRGINQDDDSVLAEMIA